MRICFFGDSFVNGTGDDDALGWVGRVVAEARRRGNDVTAYNLGIRGNTSADIAARWKREAEPRLSPEHDGRLLFSFGTNDCASTTVASRPRVARTESLAHAETILEEARRWLPTLMIGPAPIAGDSAANARVRDLSHDYARVCASLGVPYLPIAPLLTESPIWTEEALAGDGAHPNRRGYALIAEAVVAWNAWREWVAS